MFIKGEVADKGGASKCSNDKLSNQGSVCLHSTQTIRVRIPLKATAHFSL